MIILYDIGIFLYGLIARITALWQTKAQLFVNGRKHIYSLAENDLAGENRKRIWFHVASLGEFEQARPLIETIKDAHPAYAIILTFFSPSGYEIRKSYQGADYIYYLPLDTPGNAQKWVHILNPHLVLFAKYDLWYHYLRALDRRKVPTLLFSSVFREGQVFFKWYGSLHRKMLHFFSHIFVQDAASRDRLAGIGVHRVSIAGDTRIDRVLGIKKQSADLSRIQAFKSNKKLIVVGSAWKSDWTLVLDAFSSRLSGVYRLLIAPHHIDERTVQQIVQDAAPLQACTFSAPSAGASVMVLDTMGMLSAVYRLADMAWVGGGFRSSGIHNVLEPAVYGLPVFFGPNYRKFIEAKELIRMGAAVTVSSSEEWLSRLSEKQNIRQMGEMSMIYVQQNAGGTQQIHNYLKLEKYL